MSNLNPTSAQEFFFPKDSSICLDNIEQPQSFQHTKSKPKPFFILGFVVICGLIYYYHHSQKKFTPKYTNKNE